MRTHYSFLHRGALSLNQGGMDKTDSLSSEIFDASSRLQAMKTNDAIEIALRLCSNGKVEFSGCQLSQLMANKTAFEFIWKAYS